MKTTFSFKHKALDVYESSLSHCLDEVPTIPASAYPPYICTPCTKKQGTNQYVYKLLQSHKLQNTLKYYYINMVEWYLLLCAKT